MYIKHFDHKNNYTKRPFSNFPSYKKNPDKPCGLSGFSIRFYILIYLNNSGAISSRLRRHVRNSCAVPSET